LREKRRKESPKRGRRSAAVNGKHFNYGKYN
jgi:hypothetical protein